jgi:hypothetical protein
VRERRPGAQIIGNRRNDGWFSEQDRFAFFVIGATGSEHQRARAALKEAMRDEGAGWKGRGGVSIAIQVSIAIRVSIIGDR